MYMIIYKVTNNVNGKIYIGQTIRTIDERISEHQRKKNSLIGKAIKRYGIESFTIESIETVTTIEMLNNREIYWIKHFKCMVPNGYNQCVGGNNTMGFTHREESKQKMSESKSKLYMGENNPFYGKTHSIEAKQKMSKQRKGRTLSEEWKRKIGESCQKKVVNLDTGEIFDSVKLASQKYNLKATHISSVCNGKRKTTGGFRWQHYDAR